MNKQKNTIILLALIWASVVSAAPHYLVRHYSVDDGLSQSTVSCILQDSNGYMWFGTWDGLNRYDGYDFVSFKPAITDNSTDHNNRIDQLWEDSGMVYARNYEGKFYKVQGNDLVAVPTPADYQPQEQDSMYVDRHGIIWRADDRAGISRLKEGEWHRFIPPQDPRYSGQLRRNFFMLTDNEGNLWVNPTGGGFSRYNYDNDELEWPFPELTNMVHTAYIDRQGLLWLSTYDRGVDCIDLSVQPFRVWDLRTHQDPVGEVRAMIAEGDDLHIYQRDSRMVYCAVQTQQYGLLLGTKGNGVIGLPVDVDCNDVYSLLEVGNTLYIATYGNGIYRLNGDQVSVIGAGLKVRDLLWADSTLIAATTSGVLVGDSLIPYYDVRCLLKDKAGRVWVGTFGGGLHLLEYTNGRYALSQDLAHSGIVLAIAEDSQGNIWYTGEQNISCYQPQTGICQHFNVLKGEKDAFFNEAKSLRIGEEIVFGYNHGYCRFHPATIHQSSFVPSLVINEIDYRNSNSIQITFAALDYAAPHKIIYSWKLSGVDDDWVTPTADRKAVYTNLKPGKYIFSVRSTNSEGVWTDNEKQITIEIARSFWQTGWMVLIVLLFVAVLSWLIWRFLRANSLLREEVEVEQKVTDIKLRFFTNISHELRTPLTLISGPVDNILTNERLSPSVREQLEIVSSNSKRMLRLINMLLDFRKMQQNQLKMKVRPVHFWNLIEETCSNFMKEAQSKNITFQRELLTKNDLVWVDRDKMDTVLFNLLSNAFKYTPANGQITVQLSEKDDFVLLSVRDTGKGIPKDKRSVLFERFQNNNELNNSGTGTGIGLNLTKELVDMHQGYIEVESEVGKGSVFIVMIRKGNEHYGTDVDLVVDDAVSGTSVVKQDNHKWAIQESKPLMLVVDDNEDMRQFISNIFSDNFTIVTAEDGLEALDCIKKEIPRVMITDLMMPNMDGIELLKRLRQDSRTESLPILLLTAKTAVESQLEGLEHGADDYITKPFSPAYLKARVFNLLLRQEKLKSSYRAQLISMDTHKQEKTPDEMFLARLMAFMDQQMDNNSLTVDDMVDYMNMGRTVFFNRLKSITGISPVEFIREVRIKRAVQLLDMNSYNITEITYMVGMSDSRYFSKCFKQVMGITPSEYKRNKNNSQPS
ncbi:MAG: response regulator [Paludibacteraceae bacterium]|nr:response regulator [Paludibacteraceae bacterium]